MKRPILYCAISFCIGIALAGVPVPALYLISLCFISIFIAAILSGNNILSHAFLYIALVLFGAAYAQNHDILPANHIANFATEEGRKVFLKGVVIGDPVVKKTFYGKNKISFTAETRSIKRDSAAEGVKGPVKVDIYTSGKATPFLVGNEIIMEGTLSRPEGLKNPGLFDYSRYLAIKNIYAILSVNENNFVEGPGGGCVNPVIRWAYSVRRNIRDAITRYVDKRYSSFLKAIIIGERKGIDSSVTDDFVKTGTVHVMAISGLHIALVAGIFFVLLKFFGIRKKPCLILTSIAVVFYCFVAGSSPPAVRATIVFVIASFGYIINRESDILNSLALAAFLILLVNPKELFDPSFQLSFGSVISIVLFAPRIEKIFGKRRNYVIKGCAVSIAASVGVFPIVARYFNIVSPIAVLANLIIVPALFVLTAASFVFLFLNIVRAGFCLEWMGAILSALTRATFYINHLFAQMPLSHVRIPAPSLFFMGLYYAFLAYLLFAKKRRHIIMAALIALNIFVWSQYLNHRAGQLKIAFLDVGKGDSAVVQFPYGGIMLVDAGSGGTEGITDTGKSIVAPYLWNNGIRHIDAVVATHFHEDHLGGILYILENFKVGCVIDNGKPSTTDTALQRKYIEIVRRKKIRRITANDKNEITGFSRAKIFVFNPAGGVRDADSNDNSLVLKIVYNDFSALFCADILSKAMGRIMPYGDILKSDIIKMPHHGGDLGNKTVARKFFELISPQVSVTSAGGRYRFSEVAKQTQELMDSLGSVNYGTQRQGAITVVSDGAHFKVMPFCQKN